MKTKDDNLALGTLLLGIAAVLFLVWVLKVGITVFLVVAESVLTMGFYIVLAYAAVALLISLYAHFFPNKTPGFVKMALSFHHGVAVTVKYFFRVIRNLFFKRSHKKTTHQV